MKPIAVLAIVLSGCYSTGQKRIADEAIVSQIVKGRSTKEDVQKLLGLPVSMYPMPNGEEQWMYMYFGGGISPASFIPIVGIVAGGGNSEYHNLILYFRADGIVDRIGRGTMMGHGGYLYGVGNPQPVPGDKTTPKPTTNTPEQPPGPPRPY